VTIRELVDASRRFVGFGLRGGSRSRGRRYVLSPDQGGIANQSQAGVFTGMWHLITINFALSAIALIVLGI
jgi:hypothetical protein